MILSDDGYTNLTVHFNEKDNWLRIIQFKKRNDEWTIKEIGCSPEVQTKLVELIVANKEKLARKEGAERDVQSK